LKSIKALINLILIVVVLNLSGCSSFFFRVMGRIVSGSAVKVEPARYKITNPIIPGVGLSVLWIGHSSFLIQMYDKVLITDPVFSQSVGMVAKRLIEPGLDASSITKLDFVIISHLHFDHLNYSSLNALPKSAAVFLPEGGAEYLPELGFKQTNELLPWHSIEQGGVRITAVPAKHFGGRYGFDAGIRNNSFVGYVIEYKGTTIYFAGDTGYDPELFKEIGKRFSIELALLPIGPVEPRSFMSRVHTDAKEALKIFADLGAQIMIPMHYRTFIQGTDSSNSYAEELLRQQIEQQHLEDRVIILDVGEQRLFP